MPDNLTALDYAEWCDDLAERWPDWADGFAPIARLLRAGEKMAERAEHCPQCCNSDALAAWENA